MNEQRPPTTVLHLTPAMALMSVAVLATASDRRWKKSELERLRMMAYLQPLLADIPSVDRFIAERVEALRLVGPKVLLDDCSKALTPRLRETAFAWAAELVQVDGAVVAEEQRFLQELAAKFSIPGPLARKLQVAAAIRRRTA